MIDHPDVLISLPMRNRAQTRIGAGLHFGAAELVEEKKLGAGSTPVPVLGDREWAGIVKVLPATLRTRAGNRDGAYRNFVGGVLWVVATNSSWSDLPERYGSWRATYVRFLRWNVAGYWQKVADAIGGHTVPGRGLLLRSAQHLALVNRRSGRARREGIFGCGLDDSSWPA
jgi:transposase